PSRAGKHGEICRFAAESVFTDQCHRRRCAHRRAGREIHRSENTRAQMIITTHAYARAGLVGNPSDGYFGKTISFVVRNFKATVRLWESPHFEIVPTHGDYARFDNVNQFVRDVRLHGYYGGLR